MHYAIGNQPLIEQLVYRSSKASRVVANIVNSAQQAAEIAGKVAVHALARRWISGQIRWHVEDRRGELDGGRAAAQCRRDESNFRGARGPCGKALFEHHDPPAISAQSLAEFDLRQAGLGPQAMKYAAKVDPIPAIAVLGPRDGFGITCRAD
ncbi:MAG: hypothetical protein KGJ86_07675 [Chloroflexota bacterium]|nr:hypothetical protein [Chloroflexota bacterium]